jgi:hypothetical protein
MCTGSTKLLCPRAFLKMTPPLLHIRDLRRDAGPLRIRHVPAG